MKTERLEKYLKKVKKNPRKKNELLIKGGEAILTVEGEEAVCSEIKGFIKISEKMLFEEITSYDLKICVVTDGRLIIAIGDTVYFGGYKENNSSNCQVVLYARTKLQEIMVTWINESIPIVSVCDICGGEKGSLIFSMFQTIEYFIRENTSLKIGKSGENKIDEYE